MRGFVTLAVGNESYYRLAANLLNSYKFSTVRKMPFAIVCDRKNAYTAQFDNVVVLKNPTMTYMDKLEMLNHAPYEENIFIDADCLVYSDLNIYWKYFPMGGG